VLASAGIGSRRQCEELIAQGRVEVDHRVVTELGTRVDAARQVISVDGTRVNARKPSYYVVNKPPGFVSTNRDPQGRPRVIDLAPRDERLFAVGRLDRSSEGLILVTNDGELAHRLTHPRFGVPKTYLAMVAGSPQPEQLKKLVQGVHLAEGVARVAAVRVRKRHKGGTELEIVLREGINREIRRLLARIGHKVLKLKRVAIGPIRLAGLPAGACRRLTHDEVKQLRALVRRGRREPTAAQGKPPRSAQGVKSDDGREGQPREIRTTGKVRTARAHGANQSGASVAPRTGTVILPDDVAPEKATGERGARRPRGKGAAPKSSGERKKRRPVASGSKSRFRPPRNKPPRRKGRR